MTVYTLQVTSGPSSGVSVSFFGGSVTIGRDPSSNLCINDSNVSRTHAQLTDNGREMVLRDLNSANGTMVNGRRVNDAVVQPGDVINVGNAQILFNLGQDRQHMAAGANLDHPPLSAGPPRWEGYQNQLEPDRRFFNIQVIGGSSSGASASFSRGSVTIGRDPSNKLRINDENVSRSHVQLTDNGREVVLRDLNSTNGTTLNGKQVAESVIRPGDVIGIGDSQVQFAEVQPSRRPATSGAYSHDPSVAARPAWSPDRLPEKPSQYPPAVAGGGGMGDVTPPYPVRTGSGVGWWLWVLIIGGVAALCIVGAIELDMLPNDLQLFSTAGAQPTAMVNEPAAPTLQTGGSQSQMRDETLVDDNGSQGEQPTTSESAPTQSDGKPADYQRVYKDTFAQISREVYQETYDDYLARIGDGPYTEKQLTYAERNSRRYSESYAAPYSEQYATGRSIPFAEKYAELIVDGHSAVWAATYAEVYVTSGSKKNAYAFANRIENGELPDYPKQIDAGQSHKYALSYAEQIDAGESSEYAAAYAEQIDSGKSDEYAADWAQEFNRLTGEGLDADVARQKATEDAESRN